MEHFIQLFVYGVSIGSVYALIALGFSIIFQTTGLLSFAHQEIMMVGGLLGYTLLAQLDMPFVVTVAAAMVFCGALAFLLERLGIARNTVRVNLVESRRRIRRALFCVGILER